MGSEGHVTLARSEVIGELQSADAGKGYVFTMSPPSFPFLKTLSQSFQLWRFNSVRVEYRPMVGATVDGSVVFGVDGGHKTVSKTSRAEVLALSPVQDTPVWKAGMLSVPQSALRTKQWYDTTDTSDIPGVIQAFVVGAGTKVVGELFLHYSVTFSGTRQSS